MIKLILLRQYPHLQHLQLPRAITIPCFFEDYIMKNYCHVKNQITAYCDEPEQISEDELFQVLLKNGEIVINGITYDLALLISVIDEDILIDAVLHYLDVDNQAIKTACLNKIKELTNE